jgi:hypothetical protein
MQSIETDAIQHFMDAVRRASKVRARVVRIEINDAINLSTEIAILLSQITTLQDELLVGAQPVTLDGGTLR